MEIALIIALTVALTLSAYAKRKSSLLRASVSDVFRPYFVASSQAASASLTAILAYATGWAGIQSGMPSMFASCLLGAGAVFFIASVFRCRAVVLWPGSAAQSVAVEMTAAKLETAISRLSALAWINMFLLMLCSILLLLLLGT